MQSDREKPERPRHVEMFLRKVALFAVEESHTCRYKQLEWAKAWLAEVQKALDEGYEVQTSLGAWWKEPRTTTVHVEGRECIRTRISLRNGSLRQRDGSLKPVGARVSRIEKYNVRFHSTLRLQEQIGEDGSVETVLVNWKRRSGRRNR